MFECEQFILCKSRILKKDVNFPNSSIGLKLEVVMLVLGCSCKFSQIHKEILGFLNVTLNELLDYSQFKKKMEHRVI